MLWRSRWPFPVFLVTAGIAFVQWVAGVRVLGDVALLIALYTVASREDRRTALTAAAILEIGVILALVQVVPRRARPELRRADRPGRGRRHPGQNIRNRRQLLESLRGAGRRGSSSSATSRAGSRRRRSAPGSRGSCTTSSRTTSP